MDTTLVITFTGPDKTGIVENLAQIIEAHQGNWEKSRMGCLAGRFAGILQVTVPENEASTLITAVKANQLGLSVIIEHGEALTPTETPLHLTLTGSDHPGIVREVAQRLLAKEINIEDLASSKFTAPMSGAAMFSAEIWLKVPSDLSIEGLQHELELLAQDLVVEIKVLKEI